MRHFSCLRLVFVVVVSIAIPSHAQGTSEPHRPRNAPKGTAPRHHEGDRTEHHEFGLDGGDGLGLNYADRGGSHRGYHDELLQQGPTRGIHIHGSQLPDDAEDHSARYEEGAYRPRGAKLAYAGVNARKHKVSIAQMHGVVVVVEDNSGGWVSASLERQSQLSSARDRAK